MFVSFRSYVHNCSSSENRKSLIKNIHTKQQGYISMKCTSWSDVPYILMTHIPPYHALTFVSFLILYYLYFFAKVNGFRLAYRECNLLCFFRSSMSPSTSSFVFLFIIVQFNVSNNTMELPNYKTEEINENSCERERVKKGKEKENFRPISTIRIGSGSIEYTVYIIHSPILWTILRLHSNICIVPKWTHSFELLRCFASWPSWKA